MAQQYSYKPNMNRNVTRKWAEARKVNYDAGWGDDGEEDDEPSPPRSQGARSFTNPPPLSTQRLSFDRGLGNEQRVFSASVAQSPQGFPQLPPSQRQYAQPPHEPTGSTGRPSIDASGRPDSRSSTRQFPPRKQSLGQNEAPAHSRAAPEEPPAKPLPFIRPADIYRRHAEEEELRRSQESSRPSIDSLPRDGPRNQSLDEPVRKRQPTLDTVAERKSEHLDSLVGAPVATDQPTVQKIDTNVPSAISIPSASSRYTDRPDPISASSGFPSRNVSLTEPQSANTPRHQLPAISRASTFDSEMFQRESLQQDQQPAVPEKDMREIQHKPSLGYRSMVKDAFQSENQRGRSLSDADESLGRSNTTSTSEISPIVTRLPDWERGLADIQEKAEPGEFTPPRRINTNRRDSPSPARRPLSMEVPPLPEPQSAVTVSETPAAQDTVKEAPATRPDPAILVQSRHPSSESVPEAHVHKQDSGMSDQSNHRTASEEWDQWSAAKREAHARLGIQDSNPTTPVIESSAISTPAPLEPLDKNMQEGKPRGIAALPSQQRPQVLRDDSFRPNLPGGWQSSTSIQKSAAEPGLPRPAFASPTVRTDSNESVPTAKPPQSGWRSEYTTGPQAQAFAAASAAGAALAGAFNGPAFASAGGSEVSSIDERHGGPTGQNTDASLAHRDFGSSTPESDAIPDESTTKAFEAETTPKAPQGQFPKLVPIKTGHPELKKTATDSVKADSPTKDSEHWWSDNDEEPAPAPAPLRTSRLSMMDPRPTISPLRTDSDDADADKLHSDIVKSLTPKSSNLEHAEERPSPNKTRSPPFAAAALAVSPGREIQALQEHNGWKPLPTPQPKEQSPVADKPSVVGQNKDEPVPASPVTSASVQAGAASHGKAAEDLPIKTRSLSKEFAIFSDVPALAPFEMGSTSTVEPVKELEGEKHSAKETAHEAATVDRQSTPEQASVKDLPIAATPSKDLPEPISTHDNTSRPTTPKVSVPVSPITPQAPKLQYESARSFPTAKIATEKILSMSNAQQRIQAYKENREVYTQPVGQLEDWLSFMNTSEHVDVFTANPISTTPYVPSPKHARHDSATPSGRQQFREDGQKLVAAASKYGAKASVLGKGLLSRGKEKFRNVSSGQKGLDRNKNVSAPGVDKSSSSAPQIPTPNIITPIDESSISTYFSNRDGARTAVEPPFSPISEISSQPQTNHQHVGEEQSPQPGSTLRVIDTTPARADTKKSAGGISAIDADEGHKSAEVLTAAHDVQRGLSVSDVSSITEPDRTQDMVEEGQAIDTTANTISPANDQQRSRHAPSYSTAMASAPVPTKEAEASEDRQEDSTLPAYQAPKPPRIAPGAQIVAIARIKPDEEPPQPGHSRPFSFAGSESILGHGTNQSLDSAMSAAQPDPISARAQGVSPLPSARRNPEELARKVQTAEEFARLRAQSQPVRAQPDPEEEFRIPGPYGQELRSLKQKTSSPIIQQMLGSTTAVQSEGDTFDVPAASSGDAFAAVGAARSQQQPGPGQYAQQTPQEAFDAMLNVPPQPIPQQTQSRESERDQPRGRSKISSLFGRSRSKSRSRRLQKDESQRPHPETSGRPGSDRRNSLFKLGGRGTSTATPGEEYDEITNHTTQISARPGTSSRKLSKDLFKNTTVGAGGYTQHQQVPVKEKKKRFSGLFSKSAKDIGPQRASTLPLNAQGPTQTFHRQATIPEQGQAQRNNFQRETMYAESVAQQHSALRQQSPQPADYQPPIQGFYGHMEDQSHPQQSYDSQQDQYSLYSHNSFRQPHPTGIYQHENRPNPYENDTSKTGAFLSPLSQQQPQYQQRPDLPRLDTGEQRTSSPFGPASAPTVPATYLANHQNTTTTFPSSTYDQSQSQQSFSAVATQHPQSYRPPSTRANKDISYGSDVFPPRTISSPVPAQRFGQSPAEASRITPRVAALHARSRSPKLGRRSSEDLEAVYDSLRGRSPTEQLGTFNSKKVSPIGGVPRSAEEQEKPWTINLPGEEPPEPNDPASATSPKAREMRRIMLERSPTAQTQLAQQEIRPQTVAEKFMGVPARPVQNAVGDNVGLRNSASAHQPIGETVSRDLGATQQTSIPTTSMQKDKAMPSRENWQTQRHNAAAPPTLSVSAPPDSDTYLAPKTTDQADVASTLPAVRDVATSHSTPSPLSNAPPKPVPSNASDEKPTEIHEMPGSRPEGYESDEEPVMSATAYPGQEWQPVFDRWDD